MATPLILITIIAALALGGTILAGNSPQLGLDLQGGFSVVLTAKGNPSSDAIEKAKDIIRQRIDGLGVAEPEVTRQGDNVVVELPGVKDRKKAQAIVGRTAKLEFRPVLALAPTGYVYRAADNKKGVAAACVPGETSTTTTAAGGSTTTAAGGSGSVTQSTEITATTSATTAAGDQSGAPVLGPAPAGDGEQAAGALPGQDGSSTSTTAPTTTTAPASSTTAAGGSTTSTTLSSDADNDKTIVVPTKESDGQKAICLQLGPVGFEGDSLSSAQAEVNTQTGEFLVSVKIKGKDKAAANKLFNACYAGGADCPTKQTAIVLDGRVESFPTVQAQNLADQSSFVIEGSFTNSEAKDLALVLRYGALPVEFERSAEQQVSPTLGRASLNAGLVAGLVGLGLVALYMLLYYRGLALVVISGLTVWGALMYSVICYLSAHSGLALSLSGVTGIIVSVGTTVDSYVVYFERLKDEVKGGKSLRSSTERGFERAFRTIVTADVSSFIGAFLLWWLTVGPVRGFAFFLGLSVILDVIVAYFFTRPLVSVLGRSSFFTEKRFFGVARGLGVGDRAESLAERPSTTSVPRPGSLTGGGR